MSGFRMIRELNAARLATETRKAHVLRAREGLLPPRDMTAAMVKLFVISVCAGLMAQAAAAQAETGSSAEARTASAGSLCAVIEAESVRNGLPQEFLARLIWKESLFDPGAVSPVGAQGIAQFMPGTAALRGLADPFDVPTAIAASAAYLADLRKGFGNLGLAAAAYNAGEDAAAGYIAGGRGLPYETQDYVLAITGHSTEEWKAAAAEFAIPGIGGTGDFAARCKLLVLRQTAPETPKAERAAWKPWSIIVAGSFSEARALRAFRAVISHHAPLLGGEKPLVTYDRNLSRGRRRMVQVAIGRDSRAAAEDLCGKLQERGGACMVTRTSR